MAEKPSHPPVDQPAADEDAPSSSASQAEPAASPPSAGAAGNPWFASQPAWPPLTLGLFSLVFAAAFSALWGGVVAAINWWRLDRPKTAWRPLIVGVIALAASIFPDWYVEGATWWVPPFLKVWALVQQKVFDNLLLWIGPAVEIVAWGLIFLEDFIPQQSLYRERRARGGPPGWVTVPILAGMLLVGLSVALAVRQKTEYESGVANAEYQRGLKLMADHKYVEAVEAFSAAVTFAPDDVDAYVQRGRLYARLGRTKKAIDDFDQALELRPSDVEARMQRAEVRIQTREYDKALEDLDRVIAARPKSAVAHGIRAAVRIQKRDLQGALEDFNAAIESAPDKALLRVYRGRLHIDLQQPAKAVDDFTAALEKQPESAVLYFDRALAYTAAGQPDEALRDLDKAVELEPKNVVNHVARARLLLDSGKPVQALKDCNAALDIVSRAQNKPAAEVRDAAGIISLRARCYVWLGRPKQAADDAAEAIELDEDWADAYYARGLAALANKEYDRANADFTKAIELSSDDSKVRARALFFRAQSYAAQGKATEAETDRTKALELVPNLADRPPLPTEPLPREKTPEDSPGKPKKDAPAPSSRKPKPRPKNAAPAEAQASR